MSEQRPERPSKKNGRPPAGNGGGPGGGGLRFGRGLFGWVLFIALAVMLFVLLNQKQAQFAKISLSDFDAQLQQDHVREVTIEGDKVMGEFRDAQPIGEKGDKVVKFQTEFPTGTLSWEAVRIERVVEVAYNHFDGRRFRHPVQFVRWRMERQPESCTFAQMETAPPIELQQVFQS